MAKKKTELVKFIGIDEARKDFNVALAAAGDGNVKLAKFAEFLRSENREAVLRQKWILDANKGRAIAMESALALLSAINAVRKKYRLKPLLVVDVIKSIQAPSDGGGSENRPSA